MKVGDIVRCKRLGYKSDDFRWNSVGLFMGTRTYNGREHPDYICAEVMWFDRTAPNGDIISTIQTDLIETIEAIPFEDTLANSLDNRVKAHRSVV